MNEIHALFTIFINDIYHRIQPTKNEGLMRQGLPAKASPLCEPIIPTFNRSVRVGSVNLLIYNKS